MSGFSSYLQSRRAGIARFFKHIQHDKESEACARFFIKTECVRILAAAAFFAFKLYYNFAVGCIAVILFAIATIAAAIALNIIFVRIEGKPTNQQKALMTRLRLMASVFYLFVIGIALGSVFSL